MPRSLFYILILASFISCGRTRNGQSHIQRVEKTDANSGKERLSMQAQELIIYSLGSHNKDSAETTGFVSLTDGYPWNENPDSLAIPSEYLGDKNIEDVSYFKLDSIYRNRFLAKTHIAETDEVFIYNYALDILLSFTVKDLDIVACLNEYVSSEDLPISQEDYMIGFEIGKKHLKGFPKYFLNTLVYVGKENPFVRSKIKPIVWKKIDSKLFPSFNKSPKDSIQVPKYLPGHTFKYETDHMEYYVQNMMTGGRLYGRHLLVCESSSKSIICNQTYFDDEGTSLAPLNDHNGVDQWTGELFKNKPPVIFGFEYLAFSCEEITFLKQNEKGIYIRCDNRH